MHRLHNMTNTTATNLAVRTNSTEHHVPSNHPQQVDCQCGQSAHGWVCCAGSYKGEVRRGILAAVARVKEGDAQRTLEHELLTSVELLEHAAHAAMAALLLVPVACSGCSAVLT